MWGYGMRYARRVMMREDYELTAEASWYLLVACLARPVVCSTWQDVCQRPQCALYLADGTGILGDEIAVHLQILGRKRKRFMSRP